MEYWSNNTLATEQNHTDNPTAKQLEKEKKDEKSATVKCERIFEITFPVTNYMVTYCKTCFINTRQNDD